LAGGSDLGNTTVVKNAPFSDDLRTREVVARAILEGGPATAADLAERLKITPAGVRRHLDSLVEEGILEAREPHLRSAASRGRGRPAKVFVMTSGGREQFEHSYDDLALMAIRFMSSQRDGNTARNDLERNDAVVTEFARYRAADLERRSLSKSSNAKAKSVRIESLANFLSKDGYAASVHQQGLGHELCQHHCPIAHVAAQYPQLCEAETEAFAKILGTHVQRLATIAHGDGVCTTFIPDLDLVNKMDEKKNAKKSLNTVKKEHRGKVAKR
jgi:predicted ArsR family transcriptional regulator